MGDSVYYTWLPYVDNWVRKWASPDNDLRYKIPELIEDARSFAYVLWLEIKEKMPDEVSCEKYYKAVVHKRLDTYMNKFYKNQYLYYNKWSIHDKSRIVPYVSVYGDAPIATNEKGADTPLWDVLNIEQSSPEDKMIIEEEQKISKSILELFVNYANEEDRDYIQSVIDYALDFIRNNPNTGLSLKSGHYNFKLLSERHNLKYSNAIRIWNNHKKRFFMRYPNISKYLQSDDVELLNKLLGDD